MSKSLKASLRRTLVGIVMITTIVSLSGVAALVPAAQAATVIKDGDVIRNPSAAGDAQFDVYIVKLVGAKKFKRLVLNPQVFNSYGHLKWSNIKLVTTEEMNSYKTSAIVRVETNPKVLALAPNGDAGSKSWLNVPAADFVAAGGDWDSVYVINATDSANYAAAADLTTQAQVLTFLTAGTLPGGTTPVVSGSVTVSLAANTPVAATLVSSANDGSQALAPMVNLNFANGTNGELKVTTLNLTRSGIAADGDLANVYLYDGNTKLAEMTSVSNRVYSFVNASGLFAVSAGATRAISVKADVINSGLSGKTVSLGVNAATDVVTNGGTVGGSFPVSGNMMSTATVTDIGRLTIGTTVTAPATVDPGVTSREIMRFNAVASNQNLSVSYIKFTNVGTVAATDLANIKLMDGANQLGTSAASLAADGTLVFDLSSAPLVINSGNTKSLTVLADVVGGTNRNFRLSVQRQADIVVRDNNYGINVKPYTDANLETFSVIQAAAATTVNTGTLTVTVDPSSPTGNVALSSTGISLAKFKFVASGESVKVTTLPIQLTLTTATNLKNVKLLLDGTQVGTTLTSLATATAQTLPTSGDFGSSFIIPVGATGKILSIVADIDSASGAGDPLIAGDTIIAQLNAGATGNAQGQTSLSSITTSAATGRLLTVASGVLTAAKNLAMNDGTAAIPTAVKGATAVKIGSFVLTAGAGEGVSVSQIQVTDSVATTFVAVAASGAAGAVTMSAAAATPSGIAATVAADWSTVGAKTGVTVASTAGMAVGDTLTGTGFTTTQPVATITRVVNATTLNTTVGTASGGGTGTVAVTAHGAISATSSDVDWTSTGVGKIITVSSLTGMAVGDAITVAGTVAGVGTITAIPAVDGGVSADITVTVTTATVVAGWTDVNGGNVANGDTLTITTSPTPFVIGEAYYIGQNGAEAANNFTFTVVSKTALIITGTASGVTGTTTAGVHAINIRSSASTNVDTLADTFQNLKLMQGATQIGNAYGTLTDVAGTNYTFTPSVAINIAAGQQAVFDAYADVKTNAITLSVNSDSNGILTHSLSTATGLVTNGNANTTGASNTTTLQNVYVAGVGALTVAVDGSSPISQQVVMGTTAVPLAKFKLTETTGAENLSITQVVVTDTVTSETHGTLSNIQLMDGSTPVGTVASIARTGATTGTVTFTGLNISVPKGGNKVLTLNGDITPYPGATAASTHALSLASGALTGTGSASGTSLGTSGASASAGTMTAVKTKLTVAKAATSPSGTAAKTAELTAAIFAFSNSSNVANQDATLSDLAVRVSIGGTFATATIRSIKVYKDSVNVANLLGQKDFAAVAQLADVAFAGWANGGGDTNPAASSLKDVVIAAGGTTNVYVTVNTSEAATNATLTLSLNAGDVKWEDGVKTGTNAYTAVDSLPVIAGTLVF